LFYVTALWNINLRFGLSETAALRGQFEVKELFNSFPLNFQSVIKKEIEKISNALGNINGELVSSKSSEPLVTLKKDKSLAEKLKYVL
jgi:hypothetical protein